MWHSATYVITGATTEGIQVDYNTTTVVCTAHTNPASPVHIGVYSNDHEILPDNPSRQEGVALITVSPPNSCQPVNSSEGCEEIKILVEHGEVRKDTQLQFHCSFTVWTFPCDQCDSPVFNLSILAPSECMSTACMHNIVLICMCATACTGHYFVVWG